MAGNFNSINSCFIFVLHSTSTFIGNVSANICHVVFIIVAFEIFVILKMSRIKEVTSSFIDGSVFTKSFKDVLKD